MRIVDKMLASIANARTIGERVVDDFIAAQIAGDSVASDGVDAICALFGPKGSLTDEAEKAAQGNVEVIHQAAIKAHETALKDLEADRILAGGIPQHRSVFGIGPAARHILTSVEKHTKVVGVELAGSLRTRSLSGKRLDRADDIEGYPIPLADCLPTGRDKFDYSLIDRRLDRNVKEYLLGDDFDDVFTHYANPRSSPFIIGSRVVDESEARRALGSFGEITRLARFKAWIRKKRVLPGVEGWRPEPSDYQTGKEILAGAGELLFCELMTHSINGNVFHEIYEYGKTYFASVSGDHCIERKRYMGAEPGGNFDRLARVNVTPGQFREARIARKSDDGDPGWQNGTPYRRY